MGLICWCENTHCDVCRGGGCTNPPSDSVVCEYIGPICDACAEQMPSTFIHPKDQPTGRSDNCPCGFDLFSVSPMFSADWQRAHRDAHLAAFPDVDEGTRRNLDMFIEIAEERDR